VGVLVLLVLVIMLGPAAAHACVETFDSGNAGWTTYSINSTGYVTGTGSSFSSTGGNPGGYIFGNVGNSSDNRLYSFEVSGTATGSLTGETLMVDYRSTGTITGPAGANVRFYIADAGGTNYFFSSAWDANTGGIWTSHTALVDAASFTPWTNNDGKTTFAQVAANPGWVGVIFTNGDFSSTNNLGFTSTNGATISIDNFGTPDPAPMPPAFVLFGPCIAALAVIRRKWKHH